jgi:uncharacterized delta-60 repeat protein
MVVAGLEQVAGVAVQEDGGVVAVGQGDREAVVVRLADSGRPDIVFGTRVLAAPDGRRTFGYALGVQADGKILVAGSTVGATGSDVGLWRLLPSGAADESFGTGGLASFGLSASAECAFGLAVDARGRAVVVGSTGDDMMVVRFTSTGTPDHTFNRVRGTGVPFFRIRSAGYASAFGVVVQRDGKVVVTGVDHRATGLPVYRIVPGDADTGTAVLDSTFGGGDGLAVVKGLDPYGTGLSLQPDGGILAVGMCLADGAGVGAVVRLTPAGTVDSRYGSATGVHVGVPGSTGGFLTAVETLPWGGVAVAGLAHIAGGDRPFVAMLNGLGAVDAIMGSSGALLLSWRDTDVAAIAVQRDGRIVVAGTTKNVSGGYSGVMYRLVGAAAASWASADPPTPQRRMRWTRRSGRREPLSLWPSGAHRRPLAGPSAASRGRQPG